MKFKKNLALVLAMSMLATAALSGCGNSGDNSADTIDATQADYLNLDGTLPIIKDAAAFEEANGGKLSMMIINDAARTVEVKDLAMVQRWKEDTGIEFDWQVIAADGAAEKLSLTLTAGDELPDAFWNFIGGLSGQYAVQYAEQDVFIPTQDLINEYCPTLVQILEDNPQYQKEIVTPDGNMYGFPYIEQMKGLVMTSGPLLINQNWLDQVGMDLPTTVDEFTDILYAFKEAGDLNGNGEADEIPALTMFGPEEIDQFGSYNMFYRFTGCFGQADSYCYGNYLADHLAVIDGKITFTGMNESIRKTADYFHQLYADGLLNVNCFESTSTTNYTNSELIQTEAKAGVVGVWTDMQITDNNVRHEYVAVPQLTGEDGGLSGFPLNYSEMQDTSDTCITTECKFPEVIACFVEYLISDPSLSVQSNWGAVGYNYYEDENGMLCFNLDENGDIIPVEPYTSFGDMRTNTTPARGSMIVLDEYYDTVCQYTYDAVNLLEFQKVNGKEEQLSRGTNVPKLLMTVEENQRLNQIQPVISDIVDRYVATSVQNGTDDASWDQYLADLKAAGVDELVQIFQTAYDRVSGTGSTDAE
ncbi:MAG TPA: extracellular solute-binding protein [Candidatus Faecivivens stercoripullorum]|uniref:Extracellular solute-binding protein n=1 Tax=Candidatus Faecivivens stercoripullorum TaxID=2840805 RepID=A0A9D1H5U0_9FIRM|nr:extracellular solute-binding protein [Candidatus Faecivivens stercoripullorum]